MKPVKPTGSEDSMFCSVVIPTIGRATLTRAVNSVFDQDGASAGVEVIVVNDSGQRLPEMAWQSNERVRLITTRRRERGVARNAGAAVARGQYLCFLDDDDWLLPHALEHLRALAKQAPGAAWLYGGIRVVDEKGTVLGEVNSGLSGNCSAQVMGGAWAPIQASLVRADDFFQVGGYDPSICGTEDLDLCRRIALRGDFANTPSIVAVLLRGRSWDTSTDYQRAPADIRKSREAVLDEPGAWQRLLGAALCGAQADYWFGRLVRVYASAAILNMRQGRAFTAASRAIAGLASCAVAGRHLFSLRFWDATRASHVPGELHFIVAAYEARNRQREAQPLGSQP